VAEVIVWNTHKTEAEMIAVSAYLNKIIHSGINGGRCFVCACLSWLAERVLDATVQPTRTTPPDPMFGSANTNTCPSFSSKITALTACQTAATALAGVAYSTSGSYAASPAGCFEKAGAASFNTHATGAAAAGEKPVCHGTFISAPSVCVFSRVLSACRLDSLRDRFFTGMNRAANPGFCQGTRISCLCPSAERTNEISRVRRSFVQIRSWVRSFARSFQKKL
jgi:hypothetical protein